MTYTVTVTFAWWWWALVITAASVLWAVLSADDGGGWFAGVDVLVRLVPAFMVSAAAWAVSGFLK